MNLIEKLDYLKSKKGDTNASLARNSGIAYTTIDGLYKKGYQNMKLSTLQALCDYFGVPIDYLARDDDPAEDPEKKEPVRLDGLDDSEHRLVNLYRSLNDEGKKSLLTQAEMHAASDAYTIKANGSHSCENAAI